MPSYEVLCGAETHTQSPWMRSKDPFNKLCLQPVIFIPQLHRRSQSLAFCSIQQKNCKMSDKQVKSIEIRFQGWQAIFIQLSPSTSSPIHADMWLLNTAWQIVHSHTPRSGTASPLHPAHFSCLSACQPWQVDRQTRTPPSVTKVHKLNC